MGDNEKLIEKYRDTDDRKYLDRLTSQNGGLVYNIAKKFFCYTIEHLHDDLIQQGWIGFLVAVDKYDSSFETKFSSYAAIWVQSKIQRFMEWEIPMVRTISTQQSRKAMFKYNKIARRLWSEDPTISEEKIKRLVARELDIEEPHIERVQAYMRKTVPLDKPLVASFEKSMTRLDTLVFDGESPEEASIQNDRMRSLMRGYKRVMRGCNDRVRWMMYYRMIRGMTLDAVGQKFELTRERVRQVEKQVIEKIRRELLR